MTHLSIQENVSLQTYNTLAVPVQTRWFADIHSDQEIRQALVFIKERQCPLLVLGGGSNVVLANDFAGLTIVIQTQGITLEKETEDHVWLSVAAGEGWHDTVMYCVDQGWYGIENLALIPGSVGAAPIQNIGAYGVELEQCFAYLEAIELATGNTVSFDREACQFAYRDSLFKRDGKDQYIITRVVLQLAKRPQWVLDYPALQAHLSHIPINTLTSRKVADTVMGIRMSKLPDPSEIPNAGSFFKNPIVSIECYEHIKTRYPNAVAYAQDTSPQTYKLAAGWLLDNAGWKGTMLNGVSMHKDQALVLTNPNRVSGPDLLAFVDQVKADIQHKYQLALEIEPRIYL
jgi:UDP-N-acetylmuramate dehydrogenase